MSSPDNPTPYPAGLLLKAVFFLAVALLLLSGIIRAPFLFWTAFTVLALYFAGLAAYLARSVIALFSGRA